MFDKKVWDLLYRKQVQPALAMAPMEWKIGMSKLDLENFSGIENLQVPGWQLLPIWGKASDEDFWRRVSRSVFNVNGRLRSLEQLFYLEERDTFHDVFGHLPILFDEDYSNYVRTLANLAQYANPNKICKQAFANAYWFTSEFGLIMEGNNRRAYGAGLLSSVDELDHVKNVAYNKLVFVNDIHQVLTRESYVVDGFQDQYLVLNSFKDLNTILRSLIKYTVLANE